MDADEVARDIEKSGRVINEICDRYSKSFWVGEDAPELLDRNLPVDRSKYQEHLDAIEKIIAALRKHFGA